METVARKGSGVRYSVTNKRFQIVERDVIWLVTIGLGITGFDIDDWII